MRDYTIYPQTQEFSPNPNLGFKNNFNPSIDSNFSEKEGGRMLGFTFRKPMRVKMVVDFEFLLLQAPSSSMAELERERERKPDLKVI